MHQINDYGLVPGEMVLPADSRALLLWEVVRVRWLTDIGFVLYRVYVLVNAVQGGDEQLLAVVLRKPGELRRNASHGTLEPPR
jgi:hypothetical protein